MSFDEFTSYQERFKKLSQMTNLNRAKFEELNLPTGIDIFSSFNYFIDNDIFGDLDGKFIHINLETAEIKEFNLSPLTEVKLCIPEGALLYSSPNKWLFYNSRTHNFQDLQLGDDRLFTYDPETKRIISLLISKIGMTFEETDFNGLLQDQSQIVKIFILPVNGISSMFINQDKIIIDALTSLKSVFVVDKFSYDIKAIVRGDMFSNMINDKFIYTKELGYSSLSVWEISGFQIEAFKIRELLFVLQNGLIIANIESGLAYIQVEADGEVIEREPKEVFDEHKYYDDYTLDNVPMVRPELEGIGEGDVCKNLTENTYLITNSKTNKIYIMYF